MAKSLPSNYRWGDDVNLRQTILLHQGHGLTGEPEWTGSLAHFLAGNPDLARAEIQAIAEDIESAGCHLIGGGAAACFTLCTPAFARLQLVERMARIMLGLAASGRPFHAQALRQAGFDQADIDRHGIDAADLAIAISRGHHPEALGNAEPRRKPADEAACAEPVEAREAA